MAIAASILFYLINDYLEFLYFSGSAVAVTLFSKKMKMHDSFLGLIATVCKTISGYAYALVPNRDWLYAVPVFDFFGNSGAIAIRSLGTKVVDEDKVGEYYFLLTLHRFF